MAIDWPGLCGTAASILPPAGVAALIGIILSLARPVSLILGLAVLALATVPSKKPGLAPKRLISLALFQALDDSEFSSEVDLTKFRDIKPHQTIPISPADTASSIVVPVLIGIALLGCVALLLWYIHRRSRNSKLLALAEIDRLESQYSADPTQAYRQLSAIVRQTISSQGSGNAMKQTTDQVLDSLQASSATELLVAQVGKLLRLADQTKFAGRIEGAALPDECVFGLTRSIVQAEVGRSVRDAEGDE